MQVCLKCIQESWIYRDYQRMHFKTNELSLVTNFKIMELFQKKTRLLYYLNLTNDKYEKITSNISNHYYDFKQPKKNKRGKIVGSRTISAPTNELKKIQYLIHKLLEYHITFPEYFFGGIKKKSNIKNAKVHKGKKYHFVTDIKNCFPSISSEMVYSSIRNLRFSDDICRIITKLTTVDGHLPQGTPTSMILNNLSMLKLGKDLEIFCKMNQIVLTIFVDDITFSSQYDFRNKTFELIDIIISHNFNISKEKTTYKENKVKITGVTVRQNTIKPTSDQIHNYYKKSTKVQRKTGLKNYFRTVSKENSTKQK